MTSHSFNTVEFLYLSGHLCYFDTRIVVMHHNDLPIPCGIVRGKPPEGDTIFFIFFKFGIVNLLAGWKVRCAKFFPYSTYFEGSRSSAVNQISKSTENGSSNHVESAPSNGKLETFKDLII